MGVVGPVEVVVTIRIAWTGVWYAVHRGRRLLGVMWKSKRYGEWVAVDLDRVGTQAPSFLKAARYLVRR